MQQKSKKNIFHSQLVKDRQGNTEADGSSLLGKNA